MKMTRRSVAVHREVRSKLADTQVDLEQDHEMNDIPIRVLAIEACGRFEVKLGRYGSWPRLVSGLLLASTRRGSSVHEDDSHANSDGCRNRDIKVASTFGRER